MNAKAKKTLGFLANSSIIASISLTSAGKADAFFIVGDISTAFKIPPPAQLTVALRDQLSPRVDPKQVVTDVSKSVVFTQTPQPTQNPQGTPPLLRLGL